MKLIKKIMSYAITMLLSLFILGFFISSTKVMPDNAKIYVDDNKKVYYAPTYLNDNSIPINNLRLTTGEEAHALKYKPDSKCRDQSYFTEEGRSLTGTFLEQIGILPKLKSRWDSYGNWLY